MSRELTVWEAQAVVGICVARQMSDETHRPRVAEDCPACRAAVVRLVDGEPTVDAERLADAFGNLPAVAFDNLARAILDAAPASTEPSTCKPALQVEPWPEVREEDLAMIRGFVDRREAPMSVYTRILAVLEHARTHAQQARTEVPHD